jgi:hypothetical protein
MRIDSACHCGYITIEGEGRCESFGHVEGQNVAIEYLSDGLTIAVDFATKIKIINGRSFARARLAGAALSPLAHPRR